MLEATLSLEDVLDHAQHRQVDHSALELLALVEPRGLDRYMGLAHEARVLPQRQRVPEDQSLSGLVSNRPQGPPLS